MAQPFTVNAVSDPSLNSLPPTALSAACLPPTALAPRACGLATTDFPGRLAGRRSRGRYCCRLPGRRSRGAHLGRLLGGLGRLHRHSRLCGRSQGLFLRLFELRNLCCLLPLLRVLCLLLDCLRLRDQQLELEPGGLVPSIDPALPLPAVILRLRHKDVRCLGLLLYGAGKHTSGGVQLCRVLDEVEEFGQIGLAIELRI
mmetsp:Transcript_44860/g.95598  ORF Transcript_44860/g.95598 Transcript_44860/m.95598 type:complete len:200 (-) Transcript_44860:1983-2582(-)